MEYTKITYNDEIYPKRLLQICDYPKELYIIGNNKLLNKNATVSIIGSRNCTEYGRKNANYFSEELSKKGICIISGMAIGIDTSAHIGALENIGKTIAVLGGGFNNIYPKQNEWLFHKILQNGGCIISEYAPNVDIDKKNFPKRNRIVSGLSDVVLVVEAEYRSGTSITARYAKNQNKTICCIPGNIENRCSIGTNKLIQQGAKLIQKPSEIIEILEEKNIFKTKIIKQQIEEIQPIQQMSKEYQEIYDIIKISPLHINDICKKLKKEVKKVAQILTELELEDLIELGTENKYKIKEK